MQETFPAVLEYLPYCKSTWTAERDYLRHPWLSSHGYVVVRADMRGSGNSGGLYFDEYAKQEQDDACQIIGQTRKWMKCIDI
jgi:predicted acyl esterase